MRIALISDIHGNLVALDAAIADARASGVARFLCLGDVALVGPRPRACIARVGALGCPVVMGNTDAWLIDPVQPGKAPDDDDRRVLHDVARWGAERISDTDRETLRTYAPTVEFDLSENGEGGSRAPLLAFHGSPTSYDEVIAPDTQDDQLAKIFDDSAQRYVVLTGGHTHRPMVRRFQRATFVNPGSVGLAVIREPGGPSAAWKPGLGRVRHPRLV